MMFRLGLGPSVTKETDGAWLQSYIDWQSYLGVTPESAPESTVLAAVGVDGRERDSIKRSLGHILLDDLKRGPMRADMLPQASTGTPLSSQLFFSAERCALAKAAGHDPLLQVEPFEISRHSSTVSDNIRGFVVRMRQVLRKGSDASGSNVSFSEDRPFIALVCLSDHADAPLDSASRLRLIIPLKPVSRLYNATGTSSPYTGLPHYTDGLFPNFAPVDGSAATTPIYCDDPVTVVTNDRFIYLFSQSGEFDPVTLWFDLNYGIQIEGQNFLMSTRSPGWHWEHLGHVLDKPVIPTQAGSATAGFSTVNKYEFATRYVDTYRNRYTAMSDRILWDSTVANDTVSLFGTIPATAALRTEQACNYDAYQLFGTVTVGGTLRIVDYMTSRNTRMVNRPQFYMDEATASTNVWQATVMATTRNDVSTYTPYVDSIYASDEWISNGTAFLSVTEPGDTPTRVLSGISLQGVTVLATVGNLSGVETDPSAEGLTRRYEPSGYVNLRWSATNDYAPEIFPTVNFFATKISSQSPVKLIQVGDYGFLLGDGQIVRIRVVGTGIEIIEVADGYFLSNEKAVCDVRGTLFGLFRDGACMVEPTSGTPTRIEHLDRLVRTQWASTLDSVTVEYDRAQDVIYMLNAALGSACLLHPNTFKITMLEGLRCKYLSTMRFQLTRRVVLWDEFGRAIAPRLYKSEDANGSNTSHALTQTTAIYPPANRRYYATATSVAYDAGIGGTRVTVATSLAPLFAREGTNVPTSTDFYHQGLPLYDISTGAPTYGQKYTLKRVEYVTIPAALRIVLDGDVTSTVAVGTVLSIDPIPFAVMTGPLSDGTSGPPSGTQKRLATYVSVVTPFMQGEQPPGATLFEAGVIPPDELLSQEPFTPGTLWVPLSITAVAKDRRGLLSSSAYVATAANTGFAKLGQTGAAGTLLLPWVRTYCTTPYFSLRESSIRGKLCASENLR